jgi:hypothetical protein
MLLHLPVLPRRKIGFWDLQRNMTTDGDTSGWGYQKNVDGHVLYDRYTVRKMHQQSPAMIDKKWHPPILMVEF